MDGQHEFCRRYYQQVMDDVRQKYTTEQIKKVWVYRTMGSYEFHGPNDEYFYGLGDCAWSAKAEGWSRIIDPDPPSED